MLRQSTACLLVGLWDLFILTAGQNDYSTGVSNCKYRIEVNPLQSYLSAKEHCESQSAALAMPKSVDEYLAIEHVFFQSGLSPTEDMSLWLGASISSDNGGEVLFRDGTRLTPVPFSSGEPRWGRLFPQYNHSSSKHVVFSSKLKYRQQNDQYKYRLFLAQENEATLNGYVCERPGYNSDQIGMCQSDNPCQNGAACVNIGCSATCSCAEGLSEPYCHNGPTCYPNPCNFRGRCKFDGSDRSCTCVPGIRETFCSKDVFDGLSSQSPECTYQMRYFGFVEKRKDARQYCRDLNADLAIVNSKEIQDSLFGDFFRNFFDRKDKVRFWIGAEREDDGNFYWNGGTMVPRNSTNGFPNWASGRPSNDTNKKYLMVSTDKSLDPNFAPMTYNSLTIHKTRATDSATDSVFRWIDADDDDVAGFICEKRSFASGFPCNSVPCQNNGTCHNEGCYYTCECILGFTGDNCEICNTPSSCQASSCENSGTCVQVGCTSGTSCDCPAKWGGERCEICQVSNPCNEFPCLLGGVCIRKSVCSTDYTCDCPNSTTGKNCETCLLNPCSENRCLNGGKCNRKDACSNDFVCECTKFYKGNLCDDAVFYPGKSPFEECHYHINSALNTTAQGRQSAGAKCESLNSSLVQIRSFQQQEFLTNFIVDSFRLRSLFYLWTGGVLKDGLWLWLNGEIIPLINENGYPKWGISQPDITGSKPNLVLTNSRTFASPGLNKSNNLVWAAFSPFSELGFICERKNTSTECSNVPCINGGRCAVVGCSYKCYCPANYVGKHCEFSVPRLIFSSSSGNFLNFTYTFVCNVEGILVPTVTWKLTGSLINSKLREIKTGKGYPFVIDNEYTGIGVVSTLTIHTVGYCFGGNTVSCWANNNVQKDKMMEQFSIEPDFYFLIRNSFYVFSNDNLYSHVEANDECQRLGGYLATIPDENTQVALEDIIEQYFVNNTWTNSESWIGVYKSNNQSFAYGTGQQLQYENWNYNLTTLFQFNCSVISVDNLWESKNCSNLTSHYICEIPDVGKPKIVDVVSPFGNGNSSSVVVTWKYDSTMSEVFHRVSATFQSSIYKDIIPSSLQTYGNTVKVTLDGIKPQVEVEILVEVVPSYCAVPITDTTSIITAPANSANLSRSGSEECLLTWKWPSATVVEVWYFLINVTVHPAVLRIEKLSTLKQTIENESYVANVSSLDRSYLFSALPNRQYTINIVGKSAPGMETSAASAEGECYFEAEVPQFVEAPEIKSPLFGDPIFAFQPVDEKNGPVSCIFLLDIYFTNDISYQVPTITEAILEEASNSSNFRQGVPFIKLAFSNPATAVEFTIGDSQNSSCNVFNSKVETRRGRVDDRSIYRGLNRPLVSNAFHNFFIVSSSPIGDEIRFAASPQFTHYASAHKRELFEKMKSSKVSSGTIKKLEELRRQKNLVEWKVLLSKNGSAGKVAFAKILNGKFLTPRQRQNIAIEVQILKKIGQHHPFVIQLFGISFDKTSGETIILLEFCPKRILLDLLIECRPKSGEHNSQSKTLNNLQLTKFCWQIAKGMQHISDLKIVHRSLSARKILITELHHCKIAGFEFAREMDKKENIYRRHDMLVSKYDCRWMAPEAYFEHVFSSASDIWSFGVVMWEIFTFGMIPYKELSGHYLELKVLHQNYRLLPPRICSDQVYTIMHNCWHVLPIFRPSFKDTNKHIETAMKVTDKYVPLYDQIYMEDPGQNFLYERDIYDEVHQPPNMKKLHKNEFENAAAFALHDNLEEALRNLEKTHSRVM